MKSETNQAEQLIQTLESIVARELEQLALELKKIQIALRNIRANLK